MTFFRNGSPLNKDSLYRWRLNLQIFLLSLPFFTILLTVAANRPFWADETYGFGQTNLPFSTLFLDGPPGQCSRAPLYYILYKIWFAVVAGAESSLVLARVPAVLAGCLFLATVMIRLKEVSLSLAILTAALLFKDNVFFAQMTEARPYPFWLLLVAALTFPLGKFLFQTEVRRDYWIVAILSLLMVMVSTGGIFFLISVCFAIALFRNDIFWKLTASLLPACVVGAYYAVLSSCGDYSANQYSFSSLMMAGDFTTIKQIIKLVLSPKDPLDVPINAALAVALYFSLRNKHTFLMERRAVLASFLVFGITSALTAAALIYRDYFFIPRMFIFLLVFRAIIVGMALYIVYRAVSMERRWILNATAVAYSILLFVFSVKTYLIR